MSIYYNGEKPASIDQVEAQGKWERLLWKLRQRERQKRLREIEQIMRHPDYQPFRRYKDESNRLNC